MLAGSVTTFGSSRDVFHQSLKYVSHHMEPSQGADELITVLPVHFTNALSPNVQLHQFPLLNRPLQVPPSAQMSGKRITARIKPGIRRIELHVPADTRPEVWGSDKSRDFGAARIEYDAEKRQERKGLKEGEEPRLREIRLQSEQLPQRGIHMLGIIRNGRESTDFHFFVSRELIVLTI